MTTPGTAALAVPPHLRPPQRHSASNRHNHSSAPNPLLHLATASASYTQPARTRLVQDEAVNSQITALAAHDAPRVQSAAQNLDAAPNESGSSAASRSRLDDSLTLPKLEASWTAMANPVESDSSRKRRREPDWGEFYRNGLPKEIIVIEDTPDPAANIGRKLAPAAPPLSAAPPPSKKRRRSPPRQATDAKSSSDDTSAALNTTAPTSISNGQQDDVALRDSRRSTRRRTNAEARRKALEKAGAVVSTYEPPPNPPKKVANVPVRVIHDNLQPQPVAEVDDADGHFIVTPDAGLTDKYTISRLLGQGTFGKVVEARERLRNRAVAVKIIRSVQKYRDASRIELRVLATLKANDERNRNQCIHLRDCFDYRGHICIVTDLLGKSVFDFLKCNSFVPFPNSHIQHFARQLFTSVAFLHDLNLIHTDLKPENILLLDDSYQLFTYSREIPSSSNATSKKATYRKVLFNSEIRLIDFGSATFQDEYHSSVVSTRHYRAPEIILGLGWSFPCDIWSIGCILVEFWTGDALFQTHDNREHLAMMEAVIGNRIDTHIAQEANKLHARGAGNTPKYFKRLKLDYPTAETARGSRRFVSAMKKLNDIVPPCNYFLKHFLDLLRKIFVFDASKRITAKQALNHPWLREATEDDGTEALKIRLNRERREKRRLARQANGGGAPA